MELYEIRKNKEKCGRDEEVIVLELRRVVDGVERVSYWLYRRVHEGWLKVWLTMVKQNKENLKKEWKGGETAVLNRLINKN